jgi:fructosamine-3-kinase
MNPLLAARLAGLGLGEVLAAEPLHGGLISATARLRCRGGTCVVKRGSGVPPDLYAIEAAALTALRVPGAPVVPEVLSHGPDWLLLEDLGPQPAWDDRLRAPDDPFWEAYGRGMAHWHGRLYGRCGWDGHTYWGTMRMDNRWCADGWDFYAEQRYRWFLRRSTTWERLSEAQRAGVDRLAGRLRRLIPAQSACLNHGDLWSGNRAITRDGRPAAIDPFIHAGWAECDLHNCLQYGGFPDAFFSAYRESHPLEPGWRERIRIFFVLHHLGLIDQGFGDPETYGELDAVLARYAS